MIKIILLGSTLIIHLNANPLLIKQEGGTWWLVALEAVEVRERSFIGTCNIGFQIWGRVHGALQQNVKQKRKGRFWGNTISSRLRFLVCVRWTGYSNTLPHWSIAFWIEHFLLHFWDYDLRHLLCLLPHQPSKLGALCVNSQKRQVFWRANAGITTVVGD